MGTGGLLKLAGPYMCYMPWSALAGKRIGVDASLIIHVLLSQHALHIITENSWDGFCESMREALVLLSKVGVSLVAVFDGRRVDAKLVNEGRAVRRAAARSALDEDNTAIAQLREMLEARRARKEVPRPASRRLWDIGRRPPGAPRPEGSFLRRVQ